MTTDNRPSTPLPGAEGVQVCIRCGRVIDAWTRPGGATRINGSGPYCRRCQPENVNDRVETRGVQP